MRFGAVLAGGASSRFGSDKALAEVEGRTLLDRAIAGLRAQCDAVVVVGRERAGLTTVADWPRAGMGPVAGIAAALRHAEAEGADEVLTCGVDVVDVPLDLARLLSPGPSFVTDNPVVGLWPASAAAQASAIIFGPGSHAVRRFADAVGARAVTLPQPLANANTPAELAAATRTRRVTALEHPLASEQPPRRIERALAPETPVAFEINGIAYAVMMASACNLEDYAVGFLLSEGLVESAAEVSDVASAVVDKGTILRVTVPPERAAPLHERIRARVAEGSCGLCGLESLEEVLRPLPALGPPERADAAAITRALAALPDHQPMGRASGAMHAAAFAGHEGAIRLVREDVGRHNALDKLVGAMARESIDPRSGFVVVTARCSYELVEKTVRAGVPMLVCISAATDLATRRAREAGLTLIALARTDTMLVLSDPANLFGGAALGL